MYYYIIYVYYIYYTKEISHFFLKVKIINISILHAYNDEN